MNTKKTNTTANDQVNRDAASIVPTSETDDGGSGSTPCSPRPRMQLKDMTNLKDWHPGYLDLTDPLVVFHGKKIVGSEYLPGGVTLYFSDGTKGVIEMMMNRDKFEVEHGKMITNGELYLTGSVSKI